MNKIIVVDSCAELNKNIEEHNNVKRVPFFINIEEEHFLADDSVNTGELVKKMKESKEVTRTAAPTPESFYEAAKGNDEVYFVTISKKLSGAYNSANVAKTMLEEDNPDTKVYVFDSKSASVGETQVVKKIQDLLLANEDFDNIVKIVNEKIENMQTIFVLEDLDNLVKNGRMSKVAGFVASALSIYPVCYSDDGEIKVKYKPRGIKNALNKLLDSIGEFTDEFKDRILYITHINNLERANIVKEKAKQLYDFKDIEIFSGSALSTVYANRSGIILAF